MWLATADKLTMTLLLLINWPTFKMQSADRPVPFRQLSYLSGRWHALVDGQWLGTDTVCPWHGRGALRGELRMAMDLVFPSPEELHNHQNIFWHCERGRRCCLCLCVSLCLACQGCSVIWRHIETDYIWVKHRDLLFHGLLPCCASLWAKQKTQPSVFGCFTLFAS